MSKKIITIVFIILTIILALNGKKLLEKRKEEINKAPKPIVKELYIKTAKAKTGTLYQQVNLLATLKANKTIKVSTKIPGFIKKIYVKESDIVKKGDLLVKIDEKDIKGNIKALRATIKALKSDLNVAKKSYITSKKVYNVGGFPKEKLDQLLSVIKLKEAKIKESYEKLELLYNQLNYLNIKAPFNGKIDNILLFEGDLAATAKPIILMSNNLKKLIFTFTKNSNIKIGDKVLYNNNLVAKVSTIYNSAKNSLFVAEAPLLKDINMPLDSNIKVTIITKEAKGCILPANSIIHKKDGTYVMVYNKEHFAPFKVEIVVSNENSVLVNPCPNSIVALGSEGKLALLTSYKKVKILKDDNE